MNLDSSVHDYQKVAALCEAKLDLAHVAAGDDSYQSLPLCVIDTVFSIGARYTSTKNTVGRFCTYFGLKCFSPNKRPPVEEQFSITEFIQCYETRGIRFLAQNVYQNTQRTSARGGILKAEAVLRWTQVLQQYNVDYFQDFDSLIGNPDIEAAIQQIPGHGSGVSLRYFYILTGSTDYVKPDRMILRFIQVATGRWVSVCEAETIIVQACHILQQEHPPLKPAVLDNLIWRYQRTQAAT